VSLASSTLSLHDALPISVSFILLHAPLWDFILFFAMMIFSSYVCFDLWRLILAALTPQQTDPPRRYSFLSATAGHFSGLGPRNRSEEHTSELQSRFDLVC